MSSKAANIAEEVALMARRYQEQRTGRSPRSVTVVLGDDTLVVTLHDALAPAERALSANPVGAAQVQEFHRQLFADSAEEMRKEVKRITGREVRESAAEVEPLSGNVIHVFTNGTMVQVFLLAASGQGSEDAEDGVIDGIGSAEDEGLRVTPHSQPPECPKSAM